MAETTSAPAGSTISTRARSGLRAGARGERDVDGDAVLRHAVHLPRAQAEAATEILGRLGRIDEFESMVRLAIAECFQLLVHLERRRGQREGQGRQIGSGFDRGEDEDRAHDQRDRHGEPAERAEEPAEEQVGQTGRGHRGRHVEESRGEELVAPREARARGEQERIARPAKEEAPRGDLARPERPRGRDGVPQQVGLDPEERSGFDLLTTGTEAAKAFLMGRRLSAVEVLRQP